MDFSGNSLLTQIIKPSVGLLLKPNFNLVCNLIHPQACKVGNTAVGQLFNQPMLPIYKVNQSLNFLKVLLMWTSLLFIACLFCIISGFQLLFVTNFVINFIACLLERQNFQAKMGLRVTKHNIYISYSLNNNQSKRFRTSGESWDFWALFLSCFQLLPFYHTTHFVHYR